MASPFNRPAKSPFTGGQPPSFKTNVNRNKTKKWVEAKGASYDGDDWGEYDEIDEYGVEQDQPEPIPQVPHMPQMPQQPQQKVTGLRHAGQSVGGPSNGGRNPSSPDDAPIPGVHRQQSFDVGDERRGLNSGMPQSATAGQLPDIPQGAPLHVQTDVPSGTMQRVDTSSSRYASSGGMPSSAENTPYSANPMHQRDFSPSALPQPLRSTTGPGNPQTGFDTTSSTNPPPRKSSLSQPSSPLVTAQTDLPEEETPRQRAPSNPQKPLPFIRPADIYKRMEEERARERASQESSRPSMDSILRPQEETRLGTPSKKSSSESLPSVQEEGRSGTPASQKKPMLPTVDEAQPAVPFSQSGSGRAPYAPPTNTFNSPDSQTELQHQPSFGFRSVVQQAFDRPDGEKSVPETPLSTQNSLRSPDPSDMSRSNTDSTAGISPIMSRVPSVGAAAEARMNNQYMSSYDYSSTPVIAEEPSDSSRPSSLQKLPETLVPRKPSPSHSREPSAESAFIPGYRRQDTPPSRGSPARTPGLEQSRRTLEPHSAQMDSEAPTSDHSVRESDPTNAAGSRPGTGRIESPAKRNSSHSIASRQSWEVESRHSEREGVNQFESNGPAQSESSFRPKLPGQWESYATTQRDGSEATSSQDIASDLTPAPSQANGAIPGDKGAETDLTSRTATRQLSSDAVQQGTPSLMQDPVAALSAAGAAIGASIKSSVGMNDGSSLRDETGDHEETDNSARGTGDIYTRPGALRMESGVSHTSKVPPTPPPKDVDPMSQSTGGASYANLDNTKPPVPVKTWDSADSGFDDEENDRLRRDIVRSLSPDKERSEGLSVPEGIPGNRESNVLPSEYGEYWEGATPDGTRYSMMPGETHVGPQGVELTRPAHIAEETSPATTVTPSRPGFLDQRFSWEKTESSPGFGDLSSFGAANRASGIGATTISQRTEEPHNDGSNAPEVVAPPQEHPPTPSLTVDDAPKQSLDRSVSPPPTGLHVVNARGAEEAVDIPPRLQTPEPQNRLRESFDDAPEAVSSEPVEASTLTLQEPEPIELHDYAAEQPSLPTTAIEPTSSLAPAAEITGPSSGGPNARIPPFRELAAIPNPTERIKAYNATRDQFATTDTGLQGWLAQTIAARPEHRDLLSGQHLSQLSTRQPTAGVGQPHKPGPSMSKFSNMLSPTSPQQGQNLPASSPMQGSSPGSSQPSGDGGLSAKKGKELLQNAGAIGGALGGKVGQGAKGLFAKGRNKLRAASGSEKVTPITTTPSPSHSQTLSRSSTQPLEQPTPQNRRNSPFRRFSSRPSSLAISDADLTPSVSNEPFSSNSRQSTPDNRSTASGISVSKRRMSPFRRRSRPSSAVSLSQMANVPEIPKEPLPLHQRSATFGGVLMNTKSKEDTDRGKLKGLRRLSAFRRNSRPSSVAVNSKDLNASDFPGGTMQLSYSGDRRASYAFGSSVPMPPPTLMEQRRASYAVGVARSVLPPAPDIFGGPEKLQEEKERPQSRLGILPTPTQETFGFPPSEPSSPKADDDRTPTATHNPNKNALEEHMGQTVSSPFDMEAPPPLSRRDTGQLSLADTDGTRESRLIESIVRHASPPLKDIESRRQSRVGIEPETIHLPLPNMGTVSGAPTPNTEKSDPMLDRSPPEPPKPVVLPKVEIPLVSAVKEGKRPAREEIVPSPEPPLPAAGEGVIPTVLADGARDAKELPSIDRNLSVASNVSESVSPIEPSPEPAVEQTDKMGVPPGKDVPVSREISNASSRPVQTSRGPSEQVSREISNVSKASRPDVSPISDEDTEARGVLGPAQQLAHGERKPDWLDDSDEEDMKTPMEKPQQHLSTASMNVDEMDKEITIEPFSRASTSNSWDQGSHEGNHVPEGRETREGWHTPAEELEHDDDSIEINEAGTASSGHIRQISDIAKLNRESLRLNAEAAAAAAALSASQEPMPDKQPLLQHIAAQAQQISDPVIPQQGRRITHEPNVADLRSAAAEDTRADEPPPVPPKSPGPAVPARQSPFAERAAPSTEQSPRAPGLLSRPSFGNERPLSYQLLPRPASGSVPQEQINVPQPQLSSPQQYSQGMSPPRVRPPIPQQRDYSLNTEVSQGPVSPEGDSPRAAGLRRTSGPVQPQPPSAHVRQKSVDRLTQAVQQPPLDPQNNPMVSRSVDPRMFQDQAPGTQRWGPDFRLANARPASPAQMRDAQGLPVGFMRGMSSQPSPGMSPQASSQSSQRQLYQPSGPSAEIPDERRSRMPGFLGGRRPPSSGPDTVSRGGSTSTQPALPGTKFHYLADIERQKAEAAASGKVSKADKKAEKKTNKTIERAQSSSELGGGKKKRFSAISGLFGRSGTTGHASSTRSNGSVKKLQKINESKTPSPAPTQSNPPAHPAQPLQQQQDFRPQSHQSSTRTWHGTRAVQQPPSSYQEPAAPAPRENVQIPPGGFYAPENNGFPARHGPEGFNAVNQQPGTFTYGQGPGQPSLPDIDPSTITTYVNGAQRSPPPHRWREPSQSPPEQGPYSAPVRHLSNPPPASLAFPSTFMPSSAPPPARHASAPGHSQVHSMLRPQHAPRMPSIGEDGRHQERPWAIQLPQGPPDPENDAHRRDSIQYAMMIRQQIAAEQQLQFQHQQQQAAFQAQQAQQAQYYPPPQTQGYPSYSTTSYDTPVLPTSSRSQRGRYSEVRSSQGPQFTLDPATIARTQLEVQERNRQLELEAQRLRQQLQDQRPSSVPDDENSLYAPPSRPQTSLSPQETAPPPLPQQYAQPPTPQNLVQPRPQHPQQAYDPQAYEQRTRQQYPSRDAGPSATEPYQYPLPTSPHDTVASPVNPAASQMAPPPPPQLQYPHPPQPPARQQQQVPAPQPPQQSYPSEEKSPNGGSGGYSSGHRNYPSAASIAAPPPPYRLNRESVDQSMNVPSETLMQTERRTEELRYQIQQRRAGGGAGDDEAPVMHAASYPGMEWEPRWEE